MSQVEVLLIINKLEITFVLQGFSSLKSYCAIQTQMRFSLFLKCTHARTHARTHAHTHAHINISAFLCLIILTSQQFQSISRKQGSFREYGNDILLNLALQKIKSHMREIRELKEVVGCMTLLDLIHIIGFALFRGVSFCVLVHTEQNRQMCTYISLWMFLWIYSSAFVPVIFFSHLLSPRLQDKSEHCCILLTYIFFFNWKPKKKTKGISLCAAIILWGNEPGIEWIIAKGKTQIWNKRALFGQCYFDWLVLHATLLYQ